MAEVKDPLNGDFTQYLGLIGAAMDSDPRKFRKLYLGEESPGLMDYLRPTGRFQQADQLRESVVRKALEIGMAQSQMPTLDQALSMFPNFPIPPGADKGPVRQVEEVAHGPGAPMSRSITRTIGMPVDAQLVPPTFDIDRIQPNTYSQVQANKNRLALGASDMAPEAPLQGIPQDLNPLTMNPTRYFNKNNELVRTGQLVSNVSTPEPQDPLQSAYEKGLHYTRAPFNHQEPTMVPVQVPGTETVEGPRPTAFREEGGIDMNYRLPPAFNALLGQYQHREGLRGTQPRTSINDAERKLMLDNRLRALRTGAPAAYPEELEDVKQALGYYGNVAPPGSNEARKVGGEADKAVAEGHVAPELERAKLAEVRARTRKASAEAAAEEDMLDLKIAEIEKRIAKMDFDMSIGQQRAEIAKLAREADLSGHLFRFMKWLSASGNVRPEDIPVMVKAIVEKVAPYLEVEADSPRKGVLGRIQDFLDVPNSGVTVRPRGSQDFPPATPAPALPTPGSSPAERAIEQPRPTVDLSKAPAGKKKGQVLTKDGKPVATWDGDKWVPK